MHTQTMKAMLPDFCLVCTGEKGIARAHNKVEYCLVATSSSVYYFTECRHHHIPYKEH